MPFALWAVALATPAPRAAAQAAIETDTSAPLPAPTAVAAADTPNDAGRSITVRWKPPAEVPGGPVLAGLEIRRAPAPRARRAPGAASGDARPAEDEVRVGTASASGTEFVDRAREGSAVAPPEDGVPYRYRVVALYGDDVAAASDWSAPARSAPSLFQTARAGALVVLLIFLLLILVSIRAARAGRAPFIRKIEGLAAIEEAVGRATEMGKPVLYVPGSQEVADIQTIYSMVILHSVAKTVARYGTPLIVPAGKAFVVPLAEETVRQAYRDAGRPEAYDPAAVRYLSDEQFAFAAGIDGIMLRERPAANLFLGAFYAESLILAETGHATGAIQIAGTANVHQIPFFVAACDYTLIGEEFFAATAYLSREARLVGTLKGSDWMKALLAAALVAGVLLASAGIAPDAARLFHVE